MTNALRSRVVLCLARAALGGALVAAMGCGPNGGRQGGMEGGGAGDSAAADGSPGDDAPATTDGLILTVHRAEESTSIVGPMSISIPAPPGQVFVIVDMSLENDGAAPAPLSVAFFTLETKQGLQYSGAPQTAQLAAGCNQSASVSVAGKTDCSIVFSVPTGATATELVYQTMDGRMTSASVTITPCVSCGSECVDVTSDDMNCGACGVVVGLGHCVAGKPSCQSGASACGGTCVDLTSDPNNCGGCGQVTPPGASCEMGQRVCASMTTFGQADIVCSGTCVTPLDDTHCGTCTRHCGGSGSCEASCAGSTCTGYYCDYKVTSPAACDSVCGPESLTCSQALALYKCSDGTLGQSPGPCNGAPPTTFMGCAFQSLECQCK